MKHLRTLFVILGLVALSSGAILAAPMYLGSWEVDDGPFWQPAPPVYSGQEAAVLLFSGVTSDTDPTHYSISTVGSNPALIDHLAWHSVIFVGGGTKFPEGAHNSGSDNLYNESGDSSAYVRDNATGSTFTNFAFYNGAAAVPEPATLTLWGGCLLGGTGFVWWRRRRKVAATA